MTERGHSRQRTFLEEALGNIPEWDVERQMDWVKGKWQCTVSHALVQSAIISYHIASRHTGALTMTTSGGRWGRPSVPAQQHMFREASRLPSPGLAGFCWGSIFWRCWVCVPSWLWWWVVSQVLACFQTHQNVYIAYVQFFVYLNKTERKK